jgi:hypothetical protein
MLPDDEMRMRQALGLNGGSSDQRPQQRDTDRKPRRFVKDGEVPVVFLTTSRGGTSTATPVNRVAAAAEALKVERAAREQGERSLNEALAVAQQLRTKLGHAELAHQEALAAERRRCEQAERALQDANAARELLEVQLSEMSERVRRATPPDIAASSEPSAPASPVKPRRKASSAIPSASEPVQWWLPSYKAKLGKRW